MRTAAEQMKAVEDLEPKIERLKALYQQYFMGIEKTPPAILRRDVDRIIYNLRKVRLQNTAVRYKFQSLVQRLNTYQQYWQRILRQIENGTYKRDLQRAAERFGKDEVMREAGRDAALALRDLDDEPSIPVYEIDVDDLDYDGGHHGEGPSRGVWTVPEGAHAYPDPLGGDDIYNDDAGAVDSYAQQQYEREQREYERKLREYHAQLRAYEEKKRAYEEYQAKQAARLAAEQVGRPHPGITPGPTAQPVVADPRGLSPGITPGPMPRPAIQSPRASQPQAPHPGITPGPMPRPAIPNPRASQPHPGITPGPMPRPAIPNPRASQPQASPTAPHAAIPAPQPHRPLPSPPQRKLPPPPPPGGAAPPPAPSNPGAAPRAPVAPAQGARARPRGGALPGTKRENAEDKETRAIYNRYVQARRQAGESTATITYDKLAKSLDAQRETLRKKHGDRQVDFEVVTKDGRTMIRPVIK